MSVVVLGISGFYHDAAAAIVRDGEIVAAAQEERFTRKKHDPRFPRHAINYCLGEAYVEPSELAAVVFYDNPDPELRPRAQEPALGRAAGPRAVDRGRRIVPRRQAVRHALRARVAEVGRAGLVHRAPPLARGLRLLSLAVPAGGDPHHRRRRRMGHHQHRARRWRGDRDARGDPLPPLARPALQRLHRVLRLQGQLGRVQADGSRAVRPAALRRSDPRAADLREARRLLPPGHGLLLLSRRGLDGEPGLLRAVRRPGARARIAASPGARWTSRPRSSRSPRRSCSGWRAMPAS